MALTLRLYRVGKKGHPTYKLVAVNRRHKSNGDYIESIGTYDPHAKSDNLKMIKDRYEYWVSRGAIISEGLRKLLKSFKK